ncbi:MAG: radical SAM protein [Candidatus Omnitrophota bacterium]
MLSEEPRLFPGEVDMIGHLIRRNGSAFFTEHEKRFILLAGQEKDPFIPVKFIRHVVAGKAAAIKLYRDLKKRGWLLRGEGGVFVPVLPYLEVHLTAHCNLDCRGCSHLAPLVDPWFVKFNHFSRDLRRLAKIFYNISVFRVLGGEPLLHPEIARMLMEVRKFFPFSSIRCLTNGILLPAMKSSFWESCRQANIEIDLSAYPDVLDVEGLRKCCVAHRVKINIDHVKKFYAWINPAGDSDPQAAMNCCRRKYYCPFLSEGAVYRCVVSMNGSVLNKKFDIGIQPEGGVSLYDQHVNGWKILAALNTPGHNCRYCATRFRPFLWGRSKGNVGEWLA